MNMMPSFLGYCTLRYIRWLHRLHSCTQHSASHPCTYILVSRRTHMHTHSTSPLCPLLTPLQLSSMMAEPTITSSACRGKYTCPCDKCSFRQPQKVSKAMWYHHAKATSEQANPGAGNYSIKTKVDIMRAMIKRRLETVEDTRHHIGHHKRAHLRNIVSCLHLMEFQSLT